MPYTFTPIVPSLHAKPLIMTVPVVLQDSMFQEMPDISVLSPCGELTDNMNGPPGLESPRCKEKTQWIKHTLASGLMIEVEATRYNGLLTESTNQPSPHVCLCNDNKGLTD